MSRLGLLVLVLLWFAFSAGSVSAQGQHGCQFVGGFKTLRNLVGHEIVGECWENEHYSANGDSTQRTSGGMLVWRKADNHTAFTDGAWTWINGPHGLQKRINWRRFTWEPDYQPDIAATPQPVTPAAPPPPTPTPTPVSAPKSTIDARLQPVLDFIAAADGEHVITTFEETGASLTYGNISDAAHFNPNINTIVFDESMSSQPLPVRAYILVHEIWHALQPWKERGQECYVGEFRAEMYATFWWSNKYGESGLPNLDNNGFIAYFNLLTSLWAHDVEHGTNRFRDRVYEEYAEVCGPQRAQSTFDYEAVRRLFRLTDVIARNALAAKLGVTPNGGVAAMAMRAYAPVIDALPYAYVMHVWSAGGTGVSHPLFDVDAFVRAYFADHRKYLQLVDKWLTDYLADPCSASQEARDWVIAIEERKPGSLRVYIRAAVIPEQIVQYVVPGIYEEAESALYDNPNLYRCVA